MEFTLIFFKLFMYHLWLVSPILGSLLLFIIAFGHIVGRIEGWDRFDALYWSLITAITVGYGDIHPVKRSSKAMSVLIAFVGVVFTGIIVALAIYATSKAFDATNDAPEVKQHAQVTQTLILLRS